MARSASFNAVPDRRKVRSDARMAASLCLFLGWTMASYVEGEGTLLFIGDGARLRAYSCSNLYSLGVSEMQRASRTTGGTLTEPGSDTGSGGGIMSVVRVVVEVE